jgi:hypothetical protein
MFKRYARRWVLQEEAGEGAPAGGGEAAPAAAAPGAPAAGAPAADAGLTPPPSLLGEKPAGEEKPAEGEAKPGEKPGEPAKPIEYTDFTLPEGLSLDTEKVGQFKTLAAELGIPQEGAQKMLDMYTAEFKQISEAPMRAWTDLQTKWREEVTSDPVIGGANLEKNLAATKAGLTALLGESAGKFFEALNITGAGNNPEIVRGLIKAAAPHAPAGPVKGNPASAGGKTAGATLYPAMAKLGNGHEG